MQKKKVVSLVFMAALLVSLGLAGIATAQKADSQSKKAEGIATSAEVASNHPDIPEGVSCNDCHAMTIDANTTATQVWLTGEYLGKAEGEGRMTDEQLWAEIDTLIGGVKKGTKTYVLATCMNNRPLSTTAEWTFDPGRRMLYGVHEINTEKLVHIKANPFVSLNWHDEFVGIEGPYRCCQIKGRCELLDGQHPDFEKILIEFAPYEDAATRMMPQNPTPEQREEVLKRVREMFKKRFLMSRITIDRITIVNKDFITRGFRNVQRWERTPES
jgi:hypothetical protein